MSTSSMITDRTCTLLVAAQYAGDRSQFDIFVDPAHDDFSGVAWAAKRIGDTWVICFEGSHDAPDWVHDFEAQAIDTEVGQVHEGFWAELSRVWGTISDQCPSPRILAGHSLGAARATLATALSVKLGVPPVAYLRWGEPATGWGPSLGDLLAGIPGRSYRNIKPHGFETDRDLVTAVPLALMGWRHPQEFSDVFAQPAPAAPWGLLAWHHFSLYLNATPETVIVPANATAA